MKDDERDYGIAVITLPPSAFRSPVPMDMQREIARKVRRKEREGRASCKAGRHVPSMDDRCYCYCGHLLGP